ncbi:hypothetical protein F2Q69_00037372 [Brassica cretica]|uniref:Uncharacterized protein n=1 Tax=Brassica cretica TaxID=69181 RepID=A0A8S9SW31_BRACR|nr:hypothetical protein F2Q69_00037372 [Brassica cretica]
MDQSHFSVSGIRLIRPPIYSLGFDLLSYGFHLKDKLLKPDHQDERINLELHTDARGWLLSDRRRMQAGRVCFLSGSRAAASYWDQEHLRAGADRMVTSWDTSKNGLGFVGFGLGFQRKSARTVSGREGASEVSSTNGLQ